MNQKQKQLGAKEQEIVLRRAEVERLHIWGHSVEDIARQLGVDSRTIDRDIQENRRGRLKMLTGDALDVKNWLRNELADYMAFMSQARTTLLQQAESFENEGAKSKAVWFAVQMENQKVEMIKSLLFSFDSLCIGSLGLNENDDHYED